MMAFLQTSLSLFLLFWTSLRTVLGCLQLNGQDISLPATSPNTRVNDDFSSKDHGVTPSLQFTCSGRVDEWDAYFEDSGNCFVRFQVWRPTTSTCTTGEYALVGTNIFDNYQVDNTLRGQFVPSPDDVIGFQPGDIVGYYVEFQGRGNNKVSFQTNSAAVSGSDSYYERNERRDDVPDILSFDTCSSRVRSDAVPLLTAVVTEDIVTTLPATTTEQPMTTMATTQPTTDPATTTLESTTATTVDVSTTTSTVDTTTNQPGTTIADTTNPETPTNPETTLVETTQPTTDALTSTQSVTTTDLPVTTTAVSTADVTTSDQSTTIVTQTEMSTAVPETTTEFLPNTDVTTQQTMSPTTESTTVTTESTTTVVSNPMDMTTGEEETTTELGTDSATGGLNRNTQSTSTAPMSEEAIPLTTLILAVVVAFVVSAVLVVTTIILFRCVWVRLRRRKRTNLNLTSGGIYSQQSNGNAYAMNSLDLGMTEDDLKAAEAYDVPLGKVPPPYSTSSQQSSARKSYTAASSKRGLEDTYEVPTGSEKRQREDRLYSNTSFGSRKLPPTRQDRVYSNTSFGSRKLSSTDFALPPVPIESEYSFSTPRKLPATNGKLADNDNADYCDVDALDAMAEFQQYQNGPVLLESEYSFSTPTNIPATNRKLEDNDNEDYCNVDALDAMAEFQAGQNALTESNIYEPLPL